jgi:hypothetical protein
MLVTAINAVCYSALNIHEQQKINACRAQRVKLECFEIPLI